MILLVTSSNRRVEVGQALEQALGESVEVCESVRRASGLLRNNEYSAVLLDDPMVEAEGDALDGLLHHWGWPCRCTSTWPSATPSALRASCGWPSDAIASPA